jgi:hypothetical protein
MQRVLYSGLTRCLLTPWFLIFSHAGGWDTPNRYYHTHLYAQASAALRWADNTGSGEELGSLTLVFFCGVARDVING